MDNGQLTIDNRTGVAMTGRTIAAPKPSPWGEGGSPDGLTDEGHTAVGEERRKKGGAQHRPYGGTQNLPHPRRGRPAGGPFLG